MRTCSICGRKHYAKGFCRACYNREILRKKNPNAIINNYKCLEKMIKKQTCDIIKKHHEEMKNDPEHLTTEFIKHLIKIDCKEI